jgi:hypothetical protein
MVVHICGPSYLGSTDRRFLVQGWLQLKHQTLSENKLKTKELGCGSRDRVLSSKHKALSSIPNVIIIIRINICQAPPLKAGLKQGSAMAHLGGWTFPQ